MEKLSSTQIAKMIDHALFETGDESKRSRSRLPSRIKI